MKCKNKKCANHGRSEYSGYCDPCAELGLHTSQSKPEAAQPAVWDSMVLTTANTLPNNPDYEILSLVSSECVTGVSLLNDFFASVRDVVGGRSQAMEDELSAIREQCLDQIKSDAYDLKASAVLALNVEFNQLSGGNKSMMFVTATGTAVKLVEIQ